MELSSRIMTWIQKENAVNEIEAVVDVRRARDSLDLIIVRQKYRAEGTEIQPVGLPTETRLNMAVRTAQITPGITTNDVGVVLMAHVRNNSFTVLDNIEVVLKLGDHISVNFLPAEGHKRGPMLPGENRDWFFPPEAFETVFGELERIKAETYSIVVLVDEREEIGRLEGTQFRELLEKFPSMPRVRMLRRAKIVIRSLPPEEQDAVRSITERLAHDDPEAWAQTERIGRGDGKGYVIQVNPRIRLVISRVGSHLVNVVDVLLHTEPVEKIAD